jgi:hypothetical protein
LCKGGVLLLCRHASGMVFLHTGFRGTPFGRRRPDFFLDCVLHLLSYSRPTL